MSVEQLVLHGRFPHLSYPRRYREKDRAAALGAMRRMGIEDIAHRPLASLSGGMRQRASLIRTLAAGPEIRLLDEAFSALDYQTRLSVTDDVYGILKREGVTVLMVTHDIPESISMGDRVLILSARPACVREILNIEFGAERSPLSCRSDPRFSQYFDHIWRELKSDDTAS